MFMPGDKIICIKKQSADFSKIFEVKYILSNCVVVGDSRFDFPIRFEDCVSYSSLLKELL